MPAIACAVVLAVPAVSRAQTATLFGALSNFDVLNDTGAEANGFEIELDGVSTVGRAVGEGLQDRVAA